MAQKVHVVMVDDLDGSSADETVTFALDGTTYELDLSSANAAGLREALAPYVGAARKVRGRGTSTRSSAGRRRRGSGGSPSAAEVRSWAREHGYQLSDRGRVPAEVRRAYDAAH